jgi:hypothetical protein
MDGASLGLFEIEASLLIACPALDWLSQNVYKTFNSCTN